MGGEGVGHIYNLKLICLNHLVYGTGHGMELCRDQRPQVDKIEV